MRISALAATFAVTFSLLGCGDGAAPREELAEVARSKDEACACTDRGCAVAARKHLDLAMARLKQRPKHVDAELTRQAMSLLSDAAICLGKYQ